MCTGWGHPNEGRAHKTHEELSEPNRKKRTPLKKNTHFGKTRAPTREHVQMLSKSRRHTPHEARSVVPGDLGLCSWDQHHTQDSRCPRLGPTFHVCFSRPEMVTTVLRPLACRGLNETVHTGLPKCP